MPPRSGKLNTAEWAGRVATINGYKTESWTLKKAQILEVHCEIEDETADALLPKTMHPSIPQYAIFNVTSYPESPAGPFTIGEIRIAGRTGVRPRGFVIRSFCNSDAARRELAARWGYPVAAGDVKLVARHDRVVGTVTVDGRTALEIEMLDRDFISGGDIQYIASMHLARNADDKNLVVVQVDPEYVFSKAERGRPHVVSVDTAAFGADPYFKLANPISACFTTADVTLPKIRYICNPEISAIQGTTKIAA
jgi:Acetoacetate decarboxylase (ADC)